MGIEIQDQIRSVLNAVWDPIGVADTVEDEYDGYIAGIYSLLQSGASEETLAKHLETIEVKQMELRGSSMNKLRAVVGRLCKLQLPEAPGPGDLVRPRTKRGDKVASWSRPGISRDGSKAVLVTADHDGGAFLFLEKRDGVWRVVAKSSSWEH